MVQFLTRLRTAIVALGVLTTCQLSVSSAEAAPALAHKAHPRGRCVACRRVVSPRQAFKRIATRRPDRLVRRHVTAVLRKARTTTRGAGGEAAIQNVSTVSVEADFHPSPALEPIGLLITEHPQFKTHEGLARRSPRGPPAFS
jgi:hypothetical protein